MNDAKNSRRDSMKTATLGTAGVLLTSQVGKGQAQRAPAKLTLQSSQHSYIKKVDLL